MNKVIVLTSQEAQVHIHAGDPDWVPCVLFYGRDGKVHYLGADSLEWISARLITALSTPGEQIQKSVSGWIDGYPVQHVLSLSEAHASLYMAVDGDGKILFWQDSRAEILHAMHLTRARASEWCDQLSRFMHA